MSLPMDETARRRVADRKAAERGLPLLEEPRYEPPRPPPETRPPWDVRAAHYLATFGRRNLLAWYVHARDFCAAHARGWAYRRVRRDRMETCRVCQFRYQYRGRLYCRTVMQGCGCPHWRFSAQEYRNALPTFACPNGYFAAARATWVGRAAFFVIASTALAAAATSLWALYRLAAWFW